MKQQRGISLAIVLMVLVIIIIIVYAVAAQGIWQVNFVNIEKANTTAFYAAEAGVSESLTKYKKGDTTWRSGAGSISSPLSLSLSNDARYFVTVLDNQNGLTDQTAPDGTVVPAGLAYFQGTGLMQQTGNSSYKIKKSVTVMVKGTTLGKFPYALASGQGIDLKASTNIYGNVKSSGNITFEAQCDVVSVKGNGRVLASQNITVSATLNMEKEQAALARGTITGSSKIKDADVVPNDVSDATLPFINNDSSVATPPAGQSGEVLPYPNLTTLLSPGNYTDHGETETEISGNFDLGGGIHYFPKGVHFTNHSNLTGRGTIVVGNSYPAIFETQIGSEKDYFPVNIVAVDGDKTGPGSSVEFSGGSTYIAGLVYSYGGIKTQSCTRIKGTVISYKGGQVFTGAQSDFSLTPLEVDCPGFEAWLGDGSGTNIVSIVSWQRK